MVPLIEIHVLCRTRSWPVHGDRCCGPSPKDGTVYLFAFRPIGREAKGKRCKLSFSGMGRSGGGCAWLSR